MLRDLTALFISKEKQGMITGIGATTKSLILLIKQQYRNVWIISAGTIFSQLLFIISIPIISRIYSPDSFGQFGVFAGLATFFSIAAPLSLQNALFLSRSRTAEFNVLTVCAVACVLIAIISPAPLLAFAAFDRIYTAHHKHLLALLLIGTVTGRSLSILFQALCVKHSAFVAASIGQVSRGTVTVAIWIILPILNEDERPFYLYVGLLIGSWAGLAPLLPTGFRELRGRIHTLTVRRLKYVVVRYRRFVLLESPAVALMVAGQHLPVLLVGALFGSAAAGLITIANQAAIRPAAMVAQTVGNVVRSHYGRARQRRDAVAAKNIRCALIIFSTLIGAIAGAFLIYSGPVIIFIFGPHWTSLDTILAATAPRLLSLIILWPFVLLLSIDEKQPYILTIELLNLMVIVATLTTGGLLTADLTLSVWAMGFGTLLINAAFVASTKFWRMDV